MTEYSETGFKKGRGMAQRSLDLIEAMRRVAKAAQPITVAASVTSCSFNASSARCRQTKCSACIAC
jgi:hypothetical protein